MTTNRYVIKKLGNFTQHTYSTGKIFLYNPKGDCIKIINPPENCRETDDLLIRAHALQVTIDREIEITDAILKDIADRQAIRMKR